MLRGMPNTVDTSPTAIVNRYQNTAQALQSRLDQCGRTHDACHLILVSKMQSADVIEPVVQGLSDHRTIALGENYLSEALEKQSQLSHLTLQWHFIGPIQSNKTADIARHFDWVHTLDREKIARRLNEQRPDDLPPLNVLIQVNIDHEDSKAGVLPDDALALARFIATQPKLTLRGLMSIPSANQVDPRAPHLKLAELLQHLQSEFPEANQLSMGMSGDWEAAVDAGATMIRIGTSIFGPRPPKEPTL